MPGSRRTIIGVMGSGREKYKELAAPLGVWLARQGYHLLTGGGQGVMAEVSKAFYGVADRKGMILGIIPGLGQGLNPDGVNSGYPDEWVAKSGYPNEWVEIPVITHLPLSGAEGKKRLSRNHINVLTSRVIIALPGTEGTLCEIELALEYRKPLLIFDPYAMMPDYSKQGAFHLTTLKEVIYCLRDYPPII